MLPLSFRGFVAALTRLDELRVHFLQLKARALDRAGKAGLGGLQELFVVALGKVGFVVRAARLVAQNRAQRDGPRQLQHVLQLPGKGEAGVGPLAAVAQVHALVAVEQLDDFFVGLLQPLVVAGYGGVLGHGVAQLAPQLEGIFRPLVLHQLAVDFRLAGDFGRGAAIALDTPARLRRTSCALGPEMNPP